MPRTHLLSEPIGAVRYLGGTTVSLARANLVVCNSHSTKRDVRRILRNRRTFVRYPRIPLLPITRRPPPGRVAGPLLIFTGGYGSVRTWIFCLTRMPSICETGGGTLPLVLLGSGYPALYARVERLGSAGMVMFSPATLMKRQSGLHSRQPTRFVIVLSLGVGGVRATDLEAFAAGIPVICGTGGAQSEVGGDAVLYADPLTATNLAGLLARIQDQDLRAHLVAAGRTQLDRVQAAIGRDGPERGSATDRQRADTNPTVTERSVQLPG